MSKEEFSKSINLKQGKIVSYDCLVCKENFTLRLFYKHLENEHNLSFNQYRIIYELDGITPLCKNNECQKEIDSSKLFCSKKCSLTFHNRSIAQRENSRKRAISINNNEEICFKRNKITSVKMTEYNKSEKHREEARQQKIKYYSDSNNEREISLLAGRNTRNRNIQLTEDKNIETNFYIVKIREDLIKIGITRIDQNRINYIKDFGEVIFEKLLPFHLASELEILVLNRTEDYFYFKSDRFDLVGSIKGTTELRTINSLPFILKLIDEFFEETIKALERVEHL